MSKTPTPQGQAREETDHVMELGNMCFGHSRGEFPVERGGGFEKELIRLFQTIDPEFNITYGDDFENNTFSIFPYYWGDCTCGYEQAEEKWSEENKHAPDCYQTEYRALPNDPQKPWTNRDLDVQVLCDKHNIPYNGGYACATHCTCAHDKEWQKWASANDHKPNCLIVRPNFFFKPTGYALMWYKYPLRDSYANQQLTLHEFHDMISECIGSLSVQGSGVSA